MKYKFYITTPIYYASGKPHLGHGYTSIAADVVARFNRSIGKDVFFQTGTDEHGQKIVEKAAAIKKEPQKFVDLIVPQFKDLMKRLNISYDYFIRTTNDEHKKFVQKMLQKSFDNGDIYKGTYKGLYCIDCERYYKEDELVNGKICPDHKREVEIVEEENYFFKLSKYEKKLLKYYSNNDEFLSPKSKAQETVNRVKEGLQDISISRSKKKLKWGIELPFDSSHVTYVWFDALFNYVSGLNINDKKDFWPCNVHLIGKDIMWFHQVYWPAFLMSCDYALPSKVFAHGFILNDNHKMGKSLGNVINPIKFSKKYGVDEFRFGLLSLGSFGEDINFTEELFIGKVNNDLNNDLGNLVSRVHSMVVKYFDGNVPKVVEVKKEDYDFIEKLNIFDKFKSEIDDMKLNFAIDTLWTAIRETNAYVNLVAPWKESDKKRLGSVMNVLVSSVYMFSKYIECIMPKKAEIIFKQYNLKNDEVFKFEFVNSVKLGEKVNIFEKIQIEKKEVEKHKGREGFSKLNLIAGRIDEVRKHPDSEKLFILQVDLGKEKRQIVSGLQGIYEEKDLQNKKVVVITNLKSAKLGGFDSNGMILACENPKIGHGDCGLLTTNLKIGENVKCGSDVADNDSQIKSKVFSKVEIYGKKGKVYFNDNELKGVGIDRDFEGFIC